MTSQEKITTAFDGWLAAEIAESTTSRNKKLDNATGARLGMLHNARSHGDFMASKARSHHGRLRSMLPAVTERDLVGNDFFAGRVLHHALTFVSGDRRLECMLSSATQNEYLERRTLGPSTGVNIGAIVGIMFQEYVPGGQLVKDHVALLSELNDEILRNIKEVRSWFRDNPTRVFDPLSPEELPIQLARDNQRSGIIMATSHVAVVAALHDDLAKVPFLEAKSITDVSNQPYYPLAG